MKKIQRLVGRKPLNSWHVSIHSNHSHKRKLLIKRNVICTSKLLFCVVLLILFSCVSAKMLRMLIV
jgi:hypothetical protein